MFLLPLTSTILMPLTSFLLFNNTIIYLHLPLMFSMSSPHISISLDWMSTMFLTTVLLITFLVTMFSLTYIPTHLQTRFFPVLLVFVTSMCTLILSNNIILLIMGWDGLGVSSYILVMFFQNANSSASSTITMMTNRLGDLAIISSIALSPLLITNFNSSLMMPLSTMMMLSLAALTKSAQFPFAAWLPAAMAAPTPISALVHSSTLVTAGAYLLIRIMKTNPSSSMMVASLSMITIILSGLTALWEQDMKKIIAMSTLSQIAMITFTASMNSPTIAFFHLITHAFFKSALFISAGLIIFSSSYQDARISPSQPYTSTILNASITTNSLALMGLPFMAGFYSKDQIIESTIKMNLSTSLVTLTIMSIMLTSIYSTRLSLLMTQFHTKTNPNSFPMKINLIEIPLTLATPLAITSGTWMTWSMMPYNITPLPTLTKITIPIMMLTGILLATIISFKSNPFMSLGPTSIDIWNLTTISSLPLFNTLPSGQMFHLMDNSWNESITLSPQQSTQLKSYYNLTLTYLLMISSIPLIMLL